MSDTSKVEVLRYHGAEPHPHADTLEIFRPHGGYTVITKIGEYAEGDLVAYIPPDNVVPEKPEYAFLWGDKAPTVKRRRIKAKKLRGIYSEGLLVKAPSGASVGDNVASVLGVEHWEDIPECDRPQNHATRGRKAQNGPKTPRYDIEPYKRYSRVLDPDEVVVVTEKIHGANARFTWTKHRFGNLPLVGRLFKGTFWCGSRNEWKSGVTIWSKAADLYPGIRRLCEAHPSYVLFGEVFGDVQDLKYGLPAGRVDFRAFDIFDGTNRKWLDWYATATICGNFDIPVVPVLGCDEVRILEPLVNYAEGKTFAGFDESQVREGCVVRPVVERSDPRIGRVQLKIVGNGYLERA